MRSLKLRSELGTLLLRFVELYGPMPPVHQLWAGQNGRQQPPFKVRPYFQSKKKNYPTNRPYDYLLCTNSEKKKVLSIKIGDNPSSPSSPKTRKMVISCFMLSSCAARFSCSFLMQHNQIQNGRTAVRTPGLRYEDSVSANFSFFFCIF